MRRSRRSPPRCSRESWVVADIAANAPDLVGHYGTISLPVGELGGGEYMFVPKASANQACAWEFIEFLTEQPQQLDIVTTAGWTPARADLDLTDFLAANPGYEGFLNQPDDLTISFYAPIPEYDEIITKLATHLLAYADYENLSATPTDPAASTAGRKRPRTSWPMATWLSKLSGAPWSPVAPFTSAPSPAGGDG
jgi:ABC-type glycerol-3-phosphate transport system substrate-binding protein